MLILPLAAVFWITAIKWVRYLDTRDFLEAMRPSAAAVAKIEAGKPKMPVRR